MSILNEPSTLTLDYCDQILARRQPPPNSRPIPVVVSDSLTWASQQVPTTDTGAISTIEHLDNSEDEVLTLLLPGPKLSKAPPNLTLLKRHFVVHERQEPYCGVNEDDWQ